MSLIGSIRQLVNLVLTERIYLQIQYYRRTKNWLSLRSPKRFTEKVQWLKLYHRRPDLPKLVNKYDCRPYVASKIGDSYLPEMIASYDTPDQINWDALPNRFVLKVSHAAAMVIICEDKSKLDQAEAELKIQYWQSIESPCFTRFHEWAYGGGNRKIIVEEFLDDGEGKPPEDYKIFCFNGEPKLIQVDFDRFNGHRRGFYDLNWQLLPFEWKVQAKQGACPRPNQLGKMLEIAKALSEGLPFARIDLYEIGDRIVFGEITLYPAAGYGRFVPDRYDEVVGDLLILPDPIRL